VAPKAKAATREGESATEALGHGLESGRAVTAPVNGELLPSSRCRTRKDHCLALTSFALQQIKDCLVVKKRVVVVHPERVRPIGIDDIGRDPFAEIGLEGIDTHVQQRLELGAVPVSRLWIGEIDQAHARLPAIPLPDGPIGTLYEIPMSHALIKQGRSLGDVGIDPDADVQAAFL